MATVFLNKPGLTCQTHADSQCGWSNQAVPCKFYMAHYFRIVSGAFLAIMLQLGGSTFSPAKASALMNDVQQLVQNGEYNAAHRKLDDFLSDNPEDLQGRFLKSLIYSETGNDTAAIPILLQLTEEYPELPEPFNNLAVLYANQGLYEKARNTLEKAIHTHPSYAIAYENLGDVYARLASLSYNRALQLDSNNSTAQIKLHLVRDIVGNKLPGPFAQGNVQVARLSPPNAITQPSLQTPPEKTPAPVDSAPLVSSKPPLPVAATLLAQHPTSVASRPVEQASTPKKAAEKLKKPDTTKPSRTVRQAFATWIRAWSNKDINTYLASYSPGFKPAKGESRATWEKTRRARVTKPGKINVSFSSLVIKQQDQQATVKFHQHYSSTSFNSSVHKTLEFIKLGNKWLINKEMVR